PTSNEEEIETENNTNPESHGNSNDEHEPPPLLLTLLLVFVPKPVREQIAGADSENDIFNIRDRVMADLEAKKKAKKEAENLANNLETKGKDAEQLKKQLEEDNQAGVDNLKNELAQKVSEEEYCQIIVNTIEKNMTKYDIKEQELEPEIKVELEKLKSREIKDNNQINEIEKKLKARKVLGVSINPHCQTPFTRLLRSSKRGDIRTGKQSGQKTVQKLQPKV
ncbi:3671_t:CDS:2, partial [Funneliformis geosporum]